MALVLDRDIHFQCAFRLRKAADDSHWAEIPKAIRNWIGKRLQASNIEVDDSFGRRWFFAGGDWRAKNPRASVKTKCAIGTGTEVAPQFWSLRYEIPCSQVTHRQWRTDIGLTVINDQEFQFSSLNSHWIAPNYIGEEPPPPLPSAPGIIPILLTSKLWRASAGDQSLFPNVSMVHEGRANEFVERLMSQRRECPLVLVAKEYATGKPLIDSASLARLLAGAASVYESESSRIDKELEHLLDSDYRCWNGRVRVYQPRIRPGDGRRHRYFTRDDIQELGAAEVERRIVQGIARRSQLTMGDGVGTIEDVDSRQREQRLKELQKHGEASDYLDLYKEEVEALSSRLKQSDAQAQYWKGQSEEAGDLEDQVRRLEYEKKQLAEQASVAQINAEASEAKGSLIEDLEDLPESVEDVARLAATAFHDQLFFTERAFGDAKKCKLRDPNIAWRVLRSMATILYKLHFDEELPFREIVTRYQNSTPFELAATESETVRRNKKLASQRKGFYKGKQREFNSHVKYGNTPGNLLRVHYLADSEAEKLVIDRCVDHLDLMSTN